MIDEAADMHEEVLTTHMISTEMAIGLLVCPSIGGVEQRFMWISEKGCGAIDETLEDTMVVRRHQL